ncbi:beta-lactamase family protein [Maribacter sp.]|nr:beta-lactamase family protein [Maribacter sp.]
MQYKMLFPLFLLFFQCCWNGTAQETLDDSTQTEVEALAKVFIQQTKAPGLSIAVRKGGTTIYAEGFGYANVEAKIKMDPSITLRTASVAKVITATALGMLATEGKLDFDTPIKKYVPYIPKMYAELTARQLAGHTSGMKHRPRGEKFKKKQYTTIRETVLLMKAPLLFEANTDYSYSTHAYNLLAAVIEGASGKTYVAYMNDVVFKSLGMTNTVVEDIKALTTKDAQLYAIKKGTLRKDKITNASYKVPGAGFRSTPTDLVKMMDAYSNGMISTTVAAEMFKSNQLKNGTKTHVGIAWRSSIDPFDNPVIEHAGSWRGARTVLVHYPKEGMSISIMINADCPVLIEETAHLFAHVIRNKTRAASDLGSIDEKIKLTLNSKEKKESHKGFFTLNPKIGSLKTTSTGFLKDNPVLYLGSTTNYAMATSFGLLYVQLHTDKALNGRIFAYYNRRDTNPTTEIPLATFEKL